MRLVSHTLWSLVGASAYLGAVAQTADDGVLDIGLVFPRQNETYAPMQRFTIIFAIQNAELAKHLEPIIDFTVLNASMTMLDKVNERTFDLKWTNYTREPHLVYSFMDFEIEGPLQLIWQTWWRRCEESSDEVRIITNSNDPIKRRLTFNIKQGTQKADLVSTTAKDEKCPNVGETITVTEKTYDAPRPLSGNDVYGTCAVAASPSQTPTSNPCRVKIDRATVESMEAKELDRRCRRLNPPSDCPVEDHAMKIAVVAGTTLAAALAAAAFLFA